MKKSIIFIISIILLISLCSCGSSTSTNNKNNQINDHNSAVKLVKNGDGYTSAAFEIRSALGFNLIDTFAPQYGVCTAKKNTDGSWEVELNGNMSGYTDKYNENTENYSFTYTVTIDSNGEVNWSSGRTEKHK